MSRFAEILLRNVVPEGIVPREYYVHMLSGISGIQLDPDGKQSSFITIIATWSTMMGTTILTMPWAFSQAGYALGLVLILGMAAICCYTSYRLLNLQKDMGVEGAPLEISEVCHKLMPGSMGRLTAGLTVVFGILSLLGSMNVYWVLMSNFLFNTGEIIHGAIIGQVGGSDNILLCPPNDTNENSVQEAIVDATDTFHQWWVQDLTIPLYLLLPFVVLCNLRDASMLTKFSSFGAIGIVVMYIYVISEAIEWGINIEFSDSDSVNYEPPYKSSFMALSGTLSFAYFIHSCIISIMRGNEKQENNTRDLTIAYVMVAATYSSISMLLYVTFPLPKFCIADNFLDNFSPQNRVLGVVRFFLLIQIMTVYPLFTVVVRNQLFTFIHGPRFPFSYKQTFSLNALLFTMCVLIAIFCPRIGLIIRWLGAVTGLVYVFVLPCVTYMVCLYKRGELTWIKAFLHGLIILIGILNFVSQFSI